MIEMIFSGHTKDPDPVRASFDRAKLDLVEQVAAEYGYPTRRATFPQWADGILRLDVEIGDIPEGSPADPEAESFSSTFKQFCLRVETLGLLPHFFVPTHEEEGWVNNHLRFSFTVRADCPECQS